MCKTASYFGFWVQSTTCFFGLHLLWVCKTGFLEVVCAVSIHSGGVSTNLLNEFAIRRRARAKDMPIVRKISLGFIGKPKDRLPTYIRLLKSAACPLQEAAWFAWGVPDQPIHEIWAQSIIHYDHGALEVQRAGR